ncbi:MAG TPA: phosphatase PAP2 family protein [Burkholderiales bacterium]
MRITDYAINLLLSMVLIVGVYQFYFWCQRNHVATPRELKLRIDEWIPYWPSWVWIYSCLYYPIILYLNFIIDSARQFTHVATSYLLLLGLQMLFFVLFPVTTPAHWRSYNRERSVSERFLALVQRFDARSNSFPSMHVSVAMLTALHLLPNLGAMAFAFPVLIALSCLFTKQHYVIDLPAGALLGWSTFGAYRTLVA